MGKSVVNEFLLNSFFIPSPNVSELKWLFGISDQPLYFKLILNKSFNKWLEAPTIHKNDKLREWLAQQKLKVKNKVAIKGKAISLSEDDLNKNYSKRKEEFIYIFFAISTEMWYLSKNLS